jgi:hypothetical protein
MVMRTVIQTLKHLSSVYELGGATSQAKELRSLVEALSPHDGRTVHEFVTAALNEPASTGKSKKRGKSTSDPNLIPSYVQKLRDASEDEERFGLVFKELKSDRRVDKVALATIINAFTGLDDSFATKATAYQRLQSFFVEQLRFKNKIRAINFR